MTTSIRGISRRTLLTRSAGAALVGSIVMPYVARAQARTPVTLAIQFFARGDYAHVYLARERGYYAEQGLEVTFKHVLGNALAMQQLTAGGADLIHADIVQMLQLQGKTPEPHMRAVGLISDKLALSLFFQKGKGIDKPKDLEGRSIVDSPGSTAPFIFNLFAKANGIDTSKVAWKNAAATAKVAMMLQAQADAVAIYLPAKPGIESKLPAGQEVGAFTFGDSVQIYGDGLITTEKYWKENKKNVQGFVRATMKGCKDSYADPKAAAEAISKHFPELNKDLAVKEMQIQATLGEGPYQKKNGLGHLDPDKMKATYEAVISVLGQPISKPVSEFFTNDAF